MRLHLAIAAATALLLASSAAVAHQTIIVVGQVINISPKVLMITSPDEKPVVVSLTPEVKVYEGSKAKKLTDVKVGRKVSVQGYGHTYDDMLILRITLLPQAKAEAITPSRKPLPQRK